MSQEQDHFEILRQNKPHMMALFASKGWELWQEWAKREVSKEYWKAIHGETAEERETARVAGKALEKFVQLPFFMAGQLGEASADGASVHPEQTTP